eukprot:5142793-Ditylum_brightwellii.AAC.1
MVQDRYEMEKYMLCGVKLAVQNAITNVRPLTSYFTQQPTVLRPLLSKRIHTQFDRIDSNQHKDRIKSTVTGWLNI